MALLKYFCPLVFVLTLVSLFWASSFLRESAPSLLVISKFQDVVPLPSFPDIFLVGFSSVHGVCRAVQTRSHGGFPGKVACQQCDPSSAGYLNLLLREDVAALEALDGTDKPMPILRIEDYIDSIGHTVSRGKLPWKVETNPDLRQNRIVIARVLSNNLFPLHGISQYRKNLEFILENEASPSKLRKLKGNIMSKHNELAMKYLWIVNRIYNVTESRLLHSTLDVNKQLYYSVPVSRRLVGLSEDPASYIFNDNGGKHTAFREAFSIGARWTLLMDGNTFFTREAWLRTMTAILTAEKTKKKIMLLPTYKVDNHLVWLSGSTSFNSTFQQVTRYLPQIILRFDAPDIFYQATKPYFSISQVDRIQLILSKYKADVHCASAAFFPPCYSKAHGTKLYPWEQTVQTNSDRPSASDNKQACREEEEQLSNSCGFTYHLSHHIDSSLVLVDGKAPQENSVVQDASVSSALRREADLVLLRLMEYEIEARQQLQE